MVPIAFDKLDDKKYSPDLLYVLDDDTYKNTDNAIEILTQFGMNNHEFYDEYYKTHKKRIRHVTVELENIQTVPENDYFEVVKTIEKLFEVYNDFIKEKYEIYKDDPKYQTRFDGEYS